MNYSSRLIDREDEDSLQDLLERCNDFYEITNGLPVSSSEADNLFRAIPENKSYDDKFIIGIFSLEKQIIGVIELVRDYPVEFTWRLGLMLLDPEFRNKGLGKRIYDDTEEWSVDLGAEIIQVGVVEQNIKGLNFWKKLGFKEIERRKRKYGNKETNLIVMTRSPVSDILQ